MLLGVVVVVEWFVMRFVFRGSGDKVEVGVGREYGIYRRALEAGRRSSGCSFLVCRCQSHARIIRQTASDVDLTVKMRRELLESGLDPQNGTDGDQITCIDGCRSASVLLEGGPRSH
jgi:hypothetical protein